MDPWNEKNTFLKPFGSFEFAGWLLHWGGCWWFQQGTTWSVPFQRSPLLTRLPRGFFVDPPRKLMWPRCGEPLGETNSLRFDNFSRMAYVLLRVRPLALLGKKDRRMVLRLKKLKRKKKTQQINSVIQMTRWYWYLTVICCLYLQLRSLEKKSVLGSP